MPTTGAPTSPTTLSAGWCRSGCRASQAPAPDDTGRVVTDTLYDTRGLPYKTNAAYVVTGAPGTALVQVDDNQVPGQTVTEHDGAGRPTASVFRAYGAERWRSTTAYRGDHVDVTPPAGGTATSTWTDARGRTTRLQQYRGTTPTGTSDDTTYRYAPAGQLDRLTDAAGNAWTWTYDLLGRQTASTDPDRGATAAQYDDAGQLTSTTDARNTTLAYTYDELGRRTGEYLGSTAGTRLAGWTYDTAVAGKGLPATSTRYAGALAYTTAVTGYTTAGPAYGSTVTIPADGTGLAGTYSYSMVYKPDGQLEQLTLPVTPGLPNESLTWGFDDFGNQRSLSAGQIGYVGGATYDPFGGLARVPLASGGASVFLSRYRDLPTGRLTGTKVELGGNPTAVADTRYTYDPAGNVTSIADGADTQCFGHDHVRRLTRAWTPSTVRVVVLPVAS